MFKKNKSLIYSIGLGIIFLGLFFSFQHIMAWAPPVSTPPAGNVNPPVYNTATNPANDAGISKNVGIFNNSPSYELDVTGDVNITGVYSGPGCDVAERYELSHGVDGFEPGEIMVIDTEAEMKIKKSNQAYSRLVVGVVSTEPSLIMGESAKIDKEKNPAIALLGRVPVRVNSENGPIKVGDYIVTSSIPGQGMSCGDYAKCQGAIVGKALQSMNEAEGIVEILIQN